MTSAARFRPRPNLGERLACVVDEENPLRVIAERVGAAMLLRIGGEVDASNVATLRRLLDEVAMATAAPGPLVVDTDQMDFMGICGFDALAETSAQCGRRGIALRLISNHPVVARTIAACGREAELPIHPDLDVALDASTGSGMVERER